MRVLAAAFLLLLADPALAGHRPPDAPGGRRAEYEANLRLFGRTGAWEPLGEASFRGHDVLEPYRSLTLGAYRRVHKNLKLGVFYKLQFGARHDEDWIEFPGDIWDWRRTAGRAENLLILDATPRTQLGFLPGRNWVLSGKTQLEFNTFNQNASLKWGPELSYFWLRGLSPVASAHLQDQLYFPLNFSRATVYERWLYLSALWHARPGLSLGPQAALRDTRWTSYPEYEAGGNLPYSVRYAAWSLGFNLVARWP